MRRGWVSSSAGAETNAEKREELPSGCFLAEQASEHGWTDASTASVVGDLHKLEGLECQTQSGGIDSPP